MSAQGRPALPPYRRSELSTPGHDLKMLQKAAASSADLVIMDLEDGCAPSQKVGARSTIARAARELDWGGKAVAFRPNAISSAYFFDDVCEVVSAAGPSLDALVLPKVQTAEEVRYLDRLLQQLEWKHGLEEGRLRLEVLIETASGVLHAEEIARASPRLSALLFGIYDYAGDVGALLHENTFEDLQFAKQQTIAAARASGLLVLDGITSRFRDLDLTRRDAERSRRMGFDGKWAIHPGQLDVIHEVFTPSRTELEKAGQQLSAYESAHREGRGAIALGEEMVDEATLRADRRNVALGRKLGLLPPV